MRPPETLVLDDDQATCVGRLKALFAEIEGQWHGVVQQRVIEKTSPLCSKFATLGTEGI